jgi:pyridoxamine 5'-phosphate oxidase
MEKLDINQIRKEYQARTLRRIDLANTPFDQFNSWLNEAIQAKVPEPNAMILSTATIQGKPSSRTVLLKHIDEQGLIFFTSYESRKAKELNENPFASVIFLWKELERQDSVEGSVEKITRTESEKYFASRPRKSQLGAWASHQSTVLGSRDILEAGYAKMESTFQDHDVPAPPYWGGFRIKPRQFEFWQGRRSRLHDRLRYRLESTLWIIERLSP